MHRLVFAVASTLAVSAPDPAVCLLAQTARPIDPAQ
jgi:hypothetical protein